MDKLWLDNHVHVKMYFGSLLSAQLYTTNELVYISGIDAKSLLRYKQKYDEGLPFCETYGESQLLDKISQNDLRDWVNAREIHDNCALKIELKQQMFQEMMKTNNRRICKNSNVMKKNLIPRGYEDKKKTIIKSDGEIEQYYEIPNTTFERLLEENNISYIKSQYKTKIRLINEMNIR